MRRIFGIKNKHLTKKILHRKLLISYIVIFLLLELVFLPFSVASFTPTNDLDSNSKPTDSCVSSSVINDILTDSSISSLVIDNILNDSSVISSVINDILTDSSNSLAVADEKSSVSGSDSSVGNYKPTDSSSNSLIVDDKPIVSSGNSYVVDYNPTDSSGNSLVKDDNFYYAPNERLVPTEEIVSITKNTLGDLSSGEEKEVKIEYFEDIDSVKLTPATNLEDVKVTIIKLKDKPEEIIDPPKKNISVYKYLDIKLIANDTYVEENNIKSLEFKFKVEKSWINNNKIDKATIRLIRYHDSEWQNLSTILNSENETYIYYTAVSPGFSTFAVVGSEVVERSESYTSEDMSIPWTIIIAFITSLTIILVVILFKARYIYRKDDSK